MTNSDYNQKWQLVEGERWSGWRSSCFWRLSSAVKGGKEKQCGTSCYKGTKLFRRSFNQRYIFEFALKTKSSRAVRFVSHGTSRALWRFHIEPIENSTCSRLITAKEKTKRKSTKTMLDLQHVWMSLLFGCFLTMLHWSSVRSAHQVLHHKGLFSRTKINPCTYGRRQKQWCHRGQHGTWEKLQHLFFIFTQVGISRISFEHL